VGNLAFQTPLGNTITISFIDGVKVDIGGKAIAAYSIKFVDADSGILIYKITLPNGHWSSPNPKYFVKWHITIDEDGTRCVDYVLDLSSKKVWIELDSKSLGDSIAWVPYAEEFAKKHNCEVLVASYHIPLFESEYPSLKFVKPTTIAEHDVDAAYRVGCFDNNYTRNKNNWRIISLQQVASDILGLDYKEIRPRIALGDTSRPIDEKYVVISEFSTLQCKFWNRPGAWQELVDYLNSIGLRVMSISKEPTKLDNVIKMNGRPMAETIRNIRHAEFIVTVGTGLAWVAWALDIPVVIVSGFSNPISEMKECIRVQNDKVCHGCYNDTTLPFDRANWDWCPRNKKFECSTSISVDSVKEAIRPLVEPIVGTVDNGGIHRFSGCKVYHRGGAGRKNDVHVATLILGEDEYGLRKLEAIRLKTPDLFHKPRVILDVGGHIGTFGMMAKTLWPSARLLAYEPNAVSESLYKKNMAANGFDNWAVYNKGVSYVKGRTVLVEDLAATGGGILVQDGEWDSKTNKMTRPGFDTRARYYPSHTDVLLTTIEDEMSEQNIDSIDILKLDCEASEVEIIKHMSDDTAKKIGMIVGEYHILGGYEEFKKLVLEKFPWFVVAPIRNPAPFCGEFIAGKPELIEQYLTISGITGTPGSVIVTGGAGFIGSHLVDSLVASGHKVSIIDNLSSGKREYVNPGADLYMVDVIDKDTIDSVFDKVRPSCVYHLAAQTSVSRSMDDPMRNINTNVIGSLNVIEAAKKYGAKKFVFISSGGAVYGEASNADELFPVKPKSPYAVSKAAVEDLLHILCKEMDVTIFRPANVYGPRQSSSADSGVISIFVSQASCGKSITVNASSSSSDGCVRDYVHVYDVVRAISMADSLPCGTYNISTGIGVSTKQLADQIMSLVDKPSVVFNGEYRPGDIDVSVLNADKLISFGWCPEIDLQSGLDMLIKSADSAERILYVAHHCSTGGMPQYLLQSVHKSLSSGSRVEVVEWNNISPHYVVQKNKIRSLCLFHSLGDDKLGDLTSILNRFNPTVIHLQELPELWLQDTMAAYIYRENRKYKIIETSHTSEVVTKKYMPDMFSFVSRYHVEKYGDLGIPYEVVEYDAGHHDRPDRNAALSSLGLNPKVKHVLNVGLFTHGKNQGQIFNVARMMPDVMFHFVGNAAGNFESYWKPLFENKPSNCIVWGERDDVDMFYSSMDAFLFTSKRELNPLVVKEALAWEMPVIMYNLQSYCGMYDGVDGIHFLENDSDECVMLKLASVLSKY